eukprot:6213727-Pleurochrysis_carterae.AAC.2
MLELDFVGCFPRETQTRSRSRKRVMAMACIDRVKSEHKVKHDPGDGEVLPNVAICNDMSN